MNTDTHKTTRPGKSIRSTLAVWLRSFIRRNIVAPAPPEAPPAPTPARTLHPHLYTADSTLAPWLLCVGFRTVRDSAGVRDFQRRPDCMAPNGAMLIQMEPPK